MDQDRVTEAMRRVTRRDFLPVELRERAHVDHPLALAHGQTNSQPSTVAAMLRLLDVRDGARVLDVGAGSGWTTALLGQLTGPRGEVVGVELEPDLVSFGRANLARWDMTWTSIRQALPDVVGWPDASPYDRILVSADARELPAALVDQLGADGILVLPVRGRMLRLVRSGAGPPRQTEHGRYRFVPLR